MELEQAKNASNLWKALRKRLHFNTTSSDLFRFSFLRIKLLNPASRFKQQLSLRCTWGKKDEDFGSYSQIDAIVKITHFQVIFKYQNKVDVCC